MRALRISLWAMGGTLLAVAALLAALWLWSGAGTSLDTTLALATRWLPAGQTLETRNVQGSVQGGGSIAWLRWRQGDLSVEVQDLEVRWNWRHWLGRTASLDRMSARLVQIDDQRPARPAGAATPLASLVLPIKVDAHWDVERLIWQGASHLEASGLAGHYIFDGARHSLQDGQVDIAAGRYTLTASLGATAPMALWAQVQGTVQTQLPGRTAPYAVAAQAQLAGALAGAAATLELQAALTPPADINSPDATDKPRARHNAYAKTTPLQAQLSARLKPWAAQPVEQAQARWQSLDIDALWPQAPQARLSGEASVTPLPGIASGWRATIQTTNAVPGPWNLRQVPVSRLVAALDYASDQWTIQSLQAQGAGGNVEAQGSLSASNPQSGWQGQAKVLGINTAAIDSRLASMVLNGQLTAQQSQGGAAFTVDLSGSRAGSAGLVGGIQLQRLSAQGSMVGSVLDITQLSLQTDDAGLDGHLTIQTQDGATAGQLALRAPGLQASANGQLGRTQGQGELQAQVIDAALASRWLARLPGAPAALASAQLQGSATLSATWSGGWQNAMGSSSTIGKSSTAASSPALQLQASARTTGLQWRTQGTPETNLWRMPSGQIDIDGPLSALALRAQGQVVRQSQRFALDAGALLTQLQDGAWQARLDAAQLTTYLTPQAETQNVDTPATPPATPPTTSPTASPTNTPVGKPWALQLSAPVTWVYQKRSDSMSLEGSAGSVLLTGPVPGAATLAWQPVRWSKQGSADAAQAPQWSTQGNLTNLPIAWLEVLSPTSLASLGVRGDVVLGGQWDASQKGRLSVRAALERTAGDLQLQSEQEDTSSRSAGLQVARLDVVIDDAQLQAKLRWESDHAGQVQGEFTTRLQREAATGAWAWAADAPLAGQLIAKLPRVGVWSVLAPPGWRLRGTLDADATLSGTRDRPLWRGNLSAQDLALRSVVDGIDFNHGTLRTSLEGERLDIKEFTLQGAGGAAGGKLSATGFVQWQDAAPTASTRSGTNSKSTSFLDRLRMEIDATATQLRVTARSERRLVISGALVARLAGAQLALRGNLKADQALFVIPEDTTPRLGDDVVVRKPTPIATANTTSVAAPSLVQPRKPGRQIQPDLVIGLDLGQDFMVRGAGVSTLIEGTVELEASGRALTPILNGTLRTAQGTYKAYGQQLDIEEGVLRFTGPYDNPALDILAIRPNLTQRVGVQITGTALQPVVRLYAEPDLPDSEKLAWLLLGRSGANGGAESALLQQAALALIGKRAGGPSGGIAGVFGLDEISVRGGADASTASGSASTTAATGATVTLGKRLSRDFYVAYERSLAGAVGTLSVFYDLSKRFTLRAQTGDQSAADLIFTLRYD